MKTYITNFSLAEYFGCDGADPSSGPWARWINGDAEFIDSDFARFVWWHLCEMQVLFVEIAVASGELLTRSPEAFEASINRHLALAESHLGEPITLQNPFAFDCDTIGAPNPTGRTSVLMLIAYAIWCVDRMIDGLRTCNTQMATAASTYAIRALNLTHEYRDHFPEVKARAISRQQSERAKAKHATDQKQEEKRFVKDCWNAWNDEPSRYKSKAAFARDVLEKCKLLESTKVIEDWCREWEKEMRKSAGTLRIVR